MRLNASRDKILILGLVLGLFSVGSVFNSCSDVEFASLGDRVQRSGGPLPPIDPVRPIVGKSLNYVIPHATNVVDVLIIFDNSGSMEFENKELGQRLANFTDVLDMGGIDWQMCYTTTNVRDEQGRTLKWKEHDSNVLKSTNDNRATIFAATAESIKDTRGSGDEQGIRATGLAMEAPENENCFRPDAALTTIIVSDEDERSGGNCDKTLYQDQRQLNQCKSLNAENLPGDVLKKVSSHFPGKLYTNHSIVIRPGDQACFDMQDTQDPAFFGFLYNDLANMTGGVTGDICAASYADQLRVMGEVTEKSLEAVPLECPPVTEPAVYIDPQMGTIYRLEGQKVFFDPPLPPGTRVQVEYKCYLY